jgi:hypothetical protein
MGEDRWSSNQSGSSISELRTAGLFTIFKKLQFALTYRLGKRASPMGMEWKGIRKENSGHTKPLVCWVRN